MNSSVIIISGSEKRLSLSAVKYFLHQYWIEECDVRTRHYWLASGGPELFLTFMFLWLFFVTKIGPNWMKDRKPLQLRKTLFVYNVFMVISNAYFFVLSLQWLNYGRLLFEFDFPPRNDYSEQTLLSIDQKILYGYTKFIDLFDTVFFVLRKKNSQITFLHLYHHFMVPVLVWVVTKIAPTVVPVAVFAVLNTLVHVIMYSYYALSAFGPHIQKYLWWKRYLTIIQITQFLLFITYGLFSVFLSNGYPKGLYWTVQMQSPLFLYLFWDFYKKSYQKTKTKIRFD